MFSWRSAKRAPSSESNSPSAKPDRQQPSVTTSSASTTSTTATTRPSSIADYPDLADSGLEDDIVSSLGDVHSVSDLDPDDIAGTGQGHDRRVNLALSRASATTLPAVSPHLRQFLRAMRVPKLSKDASGGYKPGSAEGEQDDLEFDWWEGQCSFHGGGTPSEGDVFSWHLNTMEKVQVLERQVNVLSENQNNNDDRYTRSKEENAGLQARLIMLEEQLRESELRAEERLDQEQRRHKEVIQRLEREKALQLENQSIRLQSLEKEVRFAESEAARCRQQQESAEAERSCLELRLADMQLSLESTRQELSHAAEQERLGRQEMEQARTLQTQVVATISNELEEAREQVTRHIRNESDGSEALKRRHTELEEELRQLKQQNTELTESNEELQAQLLSSGLQEGRQLLESGPRSLAVELDAMSAGQLQKTLGEQQEVNKQLRTYIDGILLSIVENYPQLLEVKSPVQAP